MTHSEAGKLGCIKSKVTQGLQAQARKDNYLLDPVMCAYCVTPISYTNRRNKFCSHSCSASFNNSGGVAKIAYTNRTVTPQLSTKTCEFCNNPLPTDSRKFCSLPCQAKARYASSKERIEDSGEFNCSPKLQKKYLLETRGHKCEICSLAEWQGQPIPLVMDHIDGHSENNQITNIRLVCGNCDMQLPTYKSKNRGNGRVSRRQRYAAGKSY